MERWKIDNPRNTVFVDGTNIKASPNKKFQKEQVAKNAKVYTEQLWQEINEEQGMLWKSTRCVTHTTEGLPG